MPLPDSTATDCITICNISGKNRATDILIKDRYYNIWAYDYDWNLKWHVIDPNGYLTCHRPYAVDIIGDGKDEVFVGFQLVNSDGKPIWNISPVNGGQADSYCTIRNGGLKPENWRFEITYCFGKGFGIWTGTGLEIKSTYGEHYESVYASHFVPHLSGNQIYAEIDHIVPVPIYIIDESGNKIDSTVVQSDRFERPIKWINKKISQIVCPSTAKVYDYKFNELFSLVMPEKSGTGFTVQTGDMNNDKKTDIAITSFVGEETSPLSWNITIFINTDSPKICNFLGCSYNYSFYNDYDDSLDPLNKK